MSNIEQRLRDDARALDALQTQDSSGEQLREHVFATPQTAAPRSDTRAGWIKWAAPATAAMLVVAVVAALLEPIEDDAKDSATPARPVATLAPPADIDTPELKTVSYENALMDEWRYLQKDLNLTKEQIEEDLSIQF
ncbi:MAG: hypothetical protein AAF290_12335 [Pseudomonadota bacterium]